MSDRIQALLDKQEIYELSCRYMRGLDRLDEEILLDVFFEDAWCDYGFTEGSPTAFAQFALATLKDHHANHHMLGNVLIELEDNAAYGEVYFQAYHKIKTDTGIGFEETIIAGRYLDRYERRDANWKFAYRSEIIDWSRTQPTADTYFEIAPDCYRGGRRDDRVYQHDDRRRN